MATGPGRVQNGRGKRLPQAREDILRLPCHQLDVLQVLGVFPGVHHRRGGLLHRDHSFDKGRQQDGEGSYSGIGIQQHILLGQIQDVPHHPGQPGRLLDVHLEERWRRHPKLVARYGLLIGLLSCRKRDIGVEQCGLD